MKLDKEIGGEDMEFEEVWSISAHLCSSFLVDSSKACSPMIS